MQRITLEEIERIFQDARQDPELITTFHIDRIKTLVEDNRHDYLSNQTFTTLYQDIDDAISDLGISKGSVESFCDKLVEYRYVDAIFQLFLGRHVRWIKRYSTKPSLTNGGVVVDIQFLDNGAYVLCKTPQMRFFKYRFDDCITFQKLTDDEIMLLTCNEHVAKGHIV